MKAGDKVVCVDDANWLMPWHPSPNPVAGQVYVIRERERAEGFDCVSLLGFPAESLFLARRFRPLDEVRAENALRAKLQNPLNV